MRSKAAAGTVAGLAAGVAFGILMQAMTTPEGTPMMVLVARILGSESLSVGWLTHLFNSGVIGAIFGWLLGGFSRSTGRALGWGATYGVAWWVLGGLVLMPLFLGMAPLAPLRMAPMRPVAWGSLMGHLVYGLVLGAAFVPLHRPLAPAAPGPEVRRRPTEVVRG